MLVSAGRELIFSTVAGIRLCFGTVVKTAWVTQGCSSDCLHSLQASSVSHTALPASGWVRHWEGTGTGQLTQTAQRDLPFHPTSWNYYRFLEVNGTTPTHTMQGADLNPRA